jgi:hypothetical protein
MVETESEQLCKCFSSFWILLSLKLRLLYCVNRGSIAVVEQALSCLGSSLVVDFGS